MHTWVEWKKNYNDKFMRRYFDNPKDAPRFVRSLQQQGYVAKIKTD